MVRTKIIIWLIFFILIIININSGTSFEMIKKDEKILNLSYNDGADLYLEGNLKWNKAKPGGTVQGSFIVKNIGTPNSELSWRISERPDWGYWTFSPNKGDGLKPEDNPIIVEVVLIVPEENEQSYSGAVRVANLQNRSGDTETLWSTLTTPYNKELNNEKINNFEKISIFFIFYQIISH